MNKLSWLLTRPDGATRAEFAERLLGAREEVLAIVPSAQEVAVTIQADNAYGNAELGGLPVDALLEITSADEHTETDPINSYLAAISSRIQGWRVHPTPIYDEREPIDAGETWPGAALVIFIQRIDGTSPEHFSSNWYHHAGYPEAHRALPPFSQPKRDRLPEDGPIGLYRQNRLLEITTPTEWVAHGYTQLHPESLTEVNLQGPYERWRHEEPFDRVGTKVLQGHEHRVL